MIKDEQIQFFKSKSILVTGATGYIGSSLIKELSRVDCTIYRSTRNLKKLDDPYEEAVSQFVDMQVCLEDISFWEELIPKIDIVFHLAAETSLYKAEDDVNLDFEHNVKPILHLLNTAKKKNKELSVIFAASSTQVGITDSLPINESFSDNPISVYDTHKLFSENYLNLYSHNTSISGVSLRLCNVYGPGVRASSSDRGVINNMVNRAIADKDLTIFEGGEFVRDYVYIDDLIKAFLLAAINANELKGKAYYIGSNRGISINDAFKKIIENVNRIASTDSEIKLVPAPKELHAIENRNVIIDSSLFSSLTGWSCEHTFEEGIEKTVRYFESNKEDRYKDVQDKEPALERIDMAGPWITDLEKKVVQDCMNKGWYNYKYVEKFQAEFAEYHDRKYAVMTPNCTTTIHLLLTAIGVSDDDEVIVPECTWVGSTAGITYLRAKTVFCDIDEDDWCLSPESVEKAITPKTKAIIAVDLYGNMPKMKQLQEIADKHGVYLIEDAAEALGSTLDGVRAGKFGIGSVFSFHRTKTLTTGEGGMLLLDDSSIYERCMFLRDHGRKSDGPAYYNYEITYKYMPFNLQAAVGYAQFLRMDELIEKKHWIFEGFQKEFKGFEGVQLNAEPEGVYNGAWTTGLVWDESFNLSKLEVMKRIEKQDLLARPFFYPLSFLPAYGSMGDRYETINPKAYSISSRGINLPGALNMTMDQIKRYAEGVKKALSDV